MNLRDTNEVVRAIREMRVRGAPAIGVTAAYGMALAAGSLEGANREAALAGLREAARELGESRPTAVNLRWAVDRMMRAAEDTEHGVDLAASLLAEAQKLHRETLESDLRLSEYGASLIPPGSSVLTHCNTGALATGGYGTALGVIRRAWEESKVNQVMATETPALAPGSAPDHLGADPTGHTRDPRRGLCSRVSDGPRPGAVRHYGRGQDSRQRRHGQQDWHSLPGCPGPPVRHPVLRGGARQHHRPEHSVRR